MEAVARLDGDVALGPLACRLDEVPGRLAICSRTIKL